jgi:hypothetical protein
MFDTFTIALIIIIILAVAMPVVFFKNNNKNIRKMKVYSEKIEKLFQPREKMYTLLGTSVGFRNTMEIGRDHVLRIETVLILLPRQSLIYYPISKITTRSDKFIVKVEYDVSLNLSPSTIERRKKFCTSAQRFEIYGRRYFKCGDDTENLLSMLDGIEVGRISYENRLLFIEFFSSDENNVDSAFKIIENSKKYYKI